MAWNVSVNNLQSPAALGYRYDDEEGPIAADLDFSGIAAAATASHGMALRAYRQLAENAPRSPRALQRVGAPSGGGFYFAAADNSRAAAPFRLVARFHRGAPIGPVEWPPWTPAELR